LDSLRKDIKEQKVTIKISNLKQDGKSLRKRGPPSKIVVVWWHITKIQEFFQTKENNNEIRSS